MFETSRSLFFIFLIFHNIKHNVELGHVVVVTRELMSIVVLAELAQTIVVVNILSSPLDIYYSFVRIVVYFCKHNYLWYSPVGVTLTAARFFFCE